MRHTRVLTLLIVGAATLALATDAAASGRRGHGHGGRVYFRPSIGFYTGPFWGGIGYPWWGPLGYYGYWGLPGAVAGLQPAAELRIQVRPRETEVYVDGHYAGVVDDFDGTFQRLRLAPGNHTLVLYLEGHRSVRQDIYAGPDSSFKVKHAMEPLGPGETAEPRPRAPEPSAAPAARRADAAPPARAPSPLLTKPPRAASPPKATAFGQLVVHSQPGGVEVWVDGERWPADSDGSLTIHLPVGVHRIELRRAGHESFETELEIRAGEARELNVQLPHDGSAL